MHLLCDLRTMMELTNDLSQKACPLLSSARLIEFLLSEEKQPDASYQSSHPTQNTSFYPSVFCLPTKSLHFHANERKEKDSTYNYCLPGCSASWLSGLKHRTRNSHHSAEWASIPPACALIRFIVFKGQHRMRLTSQERQRTCLWISSLLAKSLILKLTLNSLLSFIGGYLWLQYANVGYIRHQSTDQNA